MKTDFDLAIVGAGFAGSILAMMARQLGFSVALIERGKHPRFVIGESSTPLANLLLEEIARDYDLPEIAPFSKWGSWQETYPHISCGLKRGFTFFYHQRDRPFLDDLERRNQLLVAASPHDRIADTHWYRPEFDQFLAEAAQQRGVEYMDQTTLAPPRFEAGNIELRGSREGKSVSAKVKFLIDASGGRGYLQSTLGIPLAALDPMPATEALFSHFRNVERWEDFHSSLDAPPYPVDEAAMHHVFEGGWIWVLRFNNGVTSAGVAAKSGVAREFNFSSGELAWRALLRRFPSIEAQFAGAKAVQPFIHMPAASFRTVAAAGDSWAMLPSAAGFVDPLLSTGFPLTLLGVQRLGRALKKHGGGDDFSEALGVYERQTLFELKTTAALIAALYARMDDFEVFSALSLLYFGAAIYSETARRLGKPELAPSFLLADHPRFGPGLNRCLEMALAGPTSPDRAALLDKIYETLAFVDAGGLSRRERRHWHPVCASDLFAAAGKFGANRGEIEELLQRCGFSN